MTSPLRAACLIMAAAPALALPRAAPAAPPPPTSPAHTSSVPLPAAPAPPMADPLPPANHDILVTAQKRPQTIEDAPNSQASITAAQIATRVNAVNIEDVLKYLPSLVVRKRHIGDTQAPLATRTAGLGASARSLIYADGALISALIGNNNGSASPRWALVSPQEIARIDILYGPFSAAYPGNSIGAVVNITTRLPERLEASVNVGTNLQTFDQYGTHEILPAYQTGVTIGDRFGPLALFASLDHVTSNGQPLAYVEGGQPAGTTGGYDVLTRTGAPTRILGAAGSEHQRQTQIKLKAALALTPAIRIDYVVGLFRNDSVAAAQTYLTTIATGMPALTAGFASNIYRYDERHWSHALSAKGTQGRFAWQVIGTLYDFGRDIQRNPTGIPGGDTGPGTITRLDGTGWQTIDAKGAWTMDAAGSSVLSLGAHGDWFRLASNRYATADWVRGAAGALNLQSRGRTRTAASWAQEAWAFLPGATLTIGGRYEWWRADDGVNYATAPLIGPIVQPARAAAKFSPKASLAWDLGRGDAGDRWTARFSFGEAWRFPTVGELYQIVTSPIAAVPNPALKPERALSEELALERRERHGTIRLALFNESVKDALLAQLGPLANSAQLGSYVQNVDRTRARGVELAIDARDILPRIDLSGSVTYADAITRSDPAQPAAEGRLLPQVPHWKASGVVTWRPTDQVSLTAGARAASRNFGTLDNSDVVGNTFQGFYKYVVVDLRAAFRLDAHWLVAFGVDNLNDAKYFLYHPFPQRSFVADLKWTL